MDAFFFLTKAITPKTRVMAVSDKVVDELIPIGDRPKNNPTKPVMPKLNATERTIVSTGSMRFDPTKRMFTRQ